MAKEIHAFLYLKLLLLALGPVSAFAGNCGTEQMFLRGTFNSWGSTSMICEDDIWIARGITFADSPEAGYKFDVRGDWSENYGAGVANRVSRSGPNISADGAGTYRIVFDYNNKRYDTMPEGNIQACGKPQMYLRGTFNNWGARLMQCLDDGTWLASGVTFEEGGRFKFDVKGDWRENYGDNRPTDGTIDAEGKSISVATNAEYNIRLDLSLRQYAVELIDPPQKEVTFICRNAHVRSGEEVFVFGDIDVLGQWSYEKALPLRPSSDVPSAWSTKVTDFPVASTVHWKCLKKGIENIVQGGQSNKIYPQDPDVLTTTASFAVPLDKLPVPDVVQQDAEFEDLFSLNHIRSIFIEISEREWNNLLNDIDRSVNRKSGIYRLADFYYGEDRATAVKVPNVGFRIRGNSSRRRPEAGAPLTRHARGNSLVRAHFRIKFNEKFDDDESVYQGSDDIALIPENKGRRFRGLSALNLKFNKDDRTYLREPIAYDLFKRFGVETARVAYVKLYIRIGDESQRYMGLFGLSEPIDKGWVERRFDEGKASYLFKSLHKKVGPADLSRTDEDNDPNAGLIGIDRIDPPAPVSVWRREHIYQPAYNLKTKKNKFAKAQDRLNEFVRALNVAKTKEDLEHIVDVPALLRAQALSVYLGMWDDYWQNANNYYLYRRKSDDRMLFIPYDYDRAFTTACADASFLNWGSGACYKDLPSIHPVLIEKVLAIQELRALYRDYVRLLASDQRNFLHPNSMEPYLRKQKELIRPAVQGYEAKDDYPYSGSLDELTYFVQERQRQVSREFGKGDILD